MKKILFALLCALPFTAAADIADEIKARLSPFEILRGEFQQSKSIRIIRKPLKSRGDFVLVKGQGVLWHTIRPMESTLKVTPAEISQIKDGKVAFRMKADEQPALKLIGKVLFAVFSADVQELKQHFEIKGSMKEGHWQAVLVPKEAWVAKVAKEISLQGGKTLESIQISEANGDRSSIQFSEVQLKSKLKPAEKALFE